MQYLPEELLINIHEYLHDGDKCMFFYSYNNEMKDKLTYKIKLNNLYHIESEHNFYVQYSHFWEACIIIKETYLKYKKFFDFNILETKVILKGSEKPKNNDKIRPKRNKRYKRHKRH